MAPFIAGAIAMAYFVACIFFMRFWKQTKDRLFLMFSISFGILALQRVAMMFVGEGSERSVFIYCVRLLAFVIILLAVIQKNREK